MQVYKIMHGLWGMGRMICTKYLVVVHNEVPGLPWEVVSVIVF